MYNLVIFDQNFDKGKPLKEKKSHKKWKKSIIFNKELLPGSIPFNKKLLTGTVPFNKKLLTGTVPFNKELLTRGVPVKIKLKI